MEAISAAATFSKKQPCIFRLPSPRQQSRPPPAADRGRDCWGRRLNFQGPPKARRKFRQRQPGRWRTATKGVRQDAAIRTPPVASRQPPQSGGLFRYCKLWGILQQPLGQQTAAKRPAASCSTPIIKKNRRLRGAACGLFAVSSVRRGGRGRFRRVQGWGRGSAGPR